MKFKKYINLLLIFLLIAGLFSYFYAVPKTEAVSSIKVTVMPNVVGQKAEYIITFKVSQTLSVGDNIFIVFPSNTLIPCSTCNPYIAAGNFTVNNVVPTQDVVANTGARSLWIKSPVSVSAGGTVTVDIKKSARISNPTKPGEYQLQVATSNESYYILSEPYKIEYSKISNLNVQLGSSTVGEQSEYLVSFVTGALGDLEKGLSSIFIEFPNEVQLPKEIYTDKVSLNNEKGKIRIKRNGNVLELILLEDISSNTQVTIDFTYAFGIKNPTSPGHYPLVVWTSKENIRVTSYFDVTDKPGVQTSVITTPPIPDGINGWFITSPVVVLIGSSNVPGSVAVYYSLDKPDSFVLYTAPLTIPEGIHTLYYYSINSSQGLQEKVKSKKFKVDSIPPTIDINLKDGMLINTVKYNVSGKIVSYSASKVLINGKAVSINPDGSFSFGILLEEGPNTISVVLKDEAGHSISKTFNVIVDTIPPKLEVYSPTYWEKFTSDTVDIKGKTDPDALLKINGEEVTLNADGTFDYTLTFDRQGIYTIKIVASDKAGNKTVDTIPVEHRKAEVVQITLKIGNKTALLNGKKVELDTAPFIDPSTNRTLVPIRFIVEAFKANVEWNGTLKTVTITGSGKSILLQIGNKIAVVNGKSVLLDQPPEIVNGRTMVPIRFVSEVLGAKVQWIADTKTIIITYILG